MKILIQQMLFLSLICVSIDLVAQTKTSSPVQVYGGYSALSNSFNGVPGAQHPLNGWNTGIAFPPWRRLRFELDYSSYHGTNLGNPQRAFLIMGGGQYEVVNFHRERIYAKALVGEGGLNGNWFKNDTTGYKNGNTGMIASLAEFLGGAIDTPIAPHTALRVEGGVQHTNFDPISPSPESQPYRLAGIPNYFGRLSASIVWLPGPESVVQPRPPLAERVPVESEIIVEGINSFGHFHLLANSWWSYLSAAGIEYDRHSWGNFIGARVDYVAEFLPVVILRQPSKTDIWGNPHSKSHETVPGIGISPIGMRLLWNNDGHLKPYLLIKLGMTGYTQKVFSQYASYENFTLQQGLGMQVKLTDRWDFRAGFAVFHQSNGFAVPSNPGLDELTYNAGLSYHLGQSRRGI